MKQVAKVVLIDNENNYLLLHRSGHPYFGNDPDIAGGTIEEGEQPIEGLIREVQEEVGITISESQARQIYKGTHYSSHGTEYFLYTAKLADRPEVILSWEHSSYEWLSGVDFFEKAKSANDDFLHMVHDMLL